MKKVSLLVGTVLFAGITAFGQNQIGSGANNIEEEYVLGEVTNVTTGKAKISKQGTLAAPGQIFVSEDFGSGKIPTSWTVKTNSSHTGGWAWTDKMSQGQYASGTAAIASTTGSNGFMILDSDFMNPGSQSSFTTVDAYVEIPIPSLVGVGSVIMSFEHYWRPFSNVEMYVLASKNGTTWDTVKVDHGVNVNVSSNTHFGLGAGGAYKEIITLSKYIAGAASPKVRIHWGGSSHYFWQVDDIKIYEGEKFQVDVAGQNQYARVLSDTTLLNYNLKDYYTKIPMKQSNKMTQGYSSAYENIGSRMVPNVEVNLNVAGPGGYAKTGKSTKKNLGINAADSNSITITTPSYKLDGGMGMYTSKLYLTSDSTLTRDGLDTATYTVEVSDSVYARDNDNGRAASVVYYNPTVVQQYEVGAYFELVELDTISSVSFYMDDANVRRTNKAGLIQCHIYRGIGLGASGVQQIQNAPLFSSKKVKITDLNIPSTGGWITMGVDRNTSGLLDTLNPGGLIVAYVADQFFGTDTIFVSLEGRNGFPGHHFLRQEQGGTWGGWSYSANETYIRLNTKPNFCPTLNGSSVAKATTACGNTDGEAEAMDPTNGQAPYKYAWNTAGTPLTKKITNLPAGIYTVTITDANGCANEFSSTVSDAGAPLITNPQITNVTCAGDTQGVVSFNLTAGAAGPGYTIVWKDGSGTTLAGDSTLKDVEAGTYTVEITDKGTPPCKQTQTYTITGPTVPLTAGNSNVTDVTCNGDKDGSIVITPAGGTTPLTINWPSGGSASTETGLSGGNVILTITDANSCVYTETFVVAEPAAIALSTGNVTEKPGTGTVEVTPTTTGGNTGGYNYTWKNSSGQTCIADPATGTITIGYGAGSNQETKGTYTVTVQDVKGCSTSLPYDMNEETLGLDAFGTNYKMNIFPNPNDGTFKVSMVNADNANYSIEVKNMLGQTVYNDNVQINGNYATTIELNDNGVYFLSVSNGDKTESYKIVVE